MCVRGDAHVGVAVLPRQWEMLGKSQALGIQLGFFPDSPFHSQLVSFFLSYSITMPLIPARPGIKGKIPEEAQHIFPLLVVTSKMIVIP